MTWDRLSIPWQAAFEEAWDAYRAGSLPIGAVTAHAETGAIITRARNRRWEREDYPFSGIHNQEIMHAEVQAILMLDDVEVKRGEAVLYTTMEPCPMCLGMWFMSNMREMHFASRDPFAGATDLLNTTWYMRYKKKRAFGPVEELEMISLAMLLEQNLRERGWRHGEFENRMRAGSPRAVALAERLAASGELFKMAEDHTPVGDVIDTLLELSSKL